MDNLGIPMGSHYHHNLTENSMLGLRESEKRYWIIPVLTAIGGVVASENQRKAAQSAEKARQAELEMQLAAQQAEREQQEEMMKKYLMYGGGALGVIMLIALIK